MDLKKVIKNLHDDNWETRRDAVFDLGTIKCDETVEILIQALNDENDMRVLKAIFFTLGEIKDNKATEVIIDYLKSDDEDVKIEAVACFGKINGDRAIKPIIQTMKDCESNKWLVLVEVLEKIGSDAIIPLINSLKDGNWKFRGRVAFVLGKLRDGKAVDPLLQALKDEHWYVRAEAANALGMIGDTRAIRYLTQSLENETLEAELNRMKSLAALNPDPRALLIASYLDIPSVKNNVSNVRYQIQEALSMLRKDKDATNSV